jgi:hypothetical protein
VDFTNRFRFSLYGLSHCTHMYTDTNMSEEHGASIFRVKLYMMRNNFLLHSLNANMVTGSS